MNFPTPPDSSCWRAPCFGFFFLACGNAGNPWERTDGRLMKKGLPKLEISWHNSDINYSRWCRINPLIEEQLWHSYTFVTLEWSEGIFKQFYSMFNIETILFIPTIFAVNRVHLPSYSRLIKGGPAFSTFALALRTLVGLECRLNLSHGWYTCGCFHKWGYPNSWMVYNGKSYDKGWFCGYPNFGKTPMFLVVWVAVILGKYPIHGSYGKRGGTVRTFLASDRFIVYFHLFPNMSQGKAMIYGNPRKKACKNNTQK